jgi:hypothetical protein
MKKSAVVLIVVFLSGMMAFAQSSKVKAEVLYFKANLSCCKARACNAVEAEIQGIVSRNYPGGNVLFREIKLAEDSNKALVEKYNAVSQTVVIVKKSKKKEKSADVSDIIRKYNQNPDKEMLEKELKAKIDEFLR